MPASVTGPILESPEISREDNASNMQDLASAFATLRAQPVQPIIQDDTWVDDSGEADVQYRLVAATHPSAAEAESTPRTPATSTVFDARSMAVSSCSRTVVSSYGSSSAPSLTLSLSAPSSATFASSAVAQNLVKIGPLDEEGYLEQVHRYPIRSIDGPQCLFSFLGCEQRFPNVVEMHQHSKTHFQGEAPPTTLLCPFRSCQWSGKSDCGHRVWDEREAHIEHSHDMAEEAAGPWLRRDQDLYRHLYKLHLITSMDLQELQRTGQLGSSGEAYVMSQGPRRDRRRHGVRPRTGAS